MPPSRAVGIDLGTTSAAIARVDESGRTAMLRDAQGDLLIPNIVFFEDEELVFGRAARQADVSQPNRAGEWAKGALGQAFSSRAIGGELLPPEVIEGCLLKHLCADARVVGAAPAIVLAAPACFDQAQRQALADSARIAGLDLLGILNDPLAAALAFAENQGYLTKGAAKPGCRILVFDLGGGTLDVAIVEIKPGRVRTMSVGGDVSLGGREWDLLLAEHLAGEFNKQFGEDPRHDMVSVRRLVEAAEEAKQALTARQQARVHVERGEHAADVTITRQTFDEITEHLLTRAKRITEETLSHSGLAWRDLAHLLLVGGATRMPMIGKMLESLTGLKPAPQVHPEEAAARGAAVYAERLLATRDKRASNLEIELTDLTARSLGVEWIDPVTCQAENVVLIPRGTELPCGTVSRAMTSTDGESSVAVQLLEGEGRRAEDCSRIAEVMIQDLPPRLPKGSSIEIQYQYTAAGQFQVAAKLEKSGQALPVAIVYKSRMSASQVEDWRTLLAGRAGLSRILTQLARHRSERGEPAEHAAPAAVVSTAPVPVATPALAPAMKATIGVIEDINLEMRDASAASRMRKRKVTPRKIAILLAGYVVSAALGLAIGYYILMRIDPRYNWLDLRLPGLSSPPPTASPQGSSGDA